MFYILEYYYYDIIQIPSAIHKLTSSKKFNNISQALMLYPEIIFPRSLESPTIIDDYINRYIPSYNNDNKYLTYNETINFKINHSRIYLGIK